VLARRLAEAIWPLPALGPLWKADLRNKN
jgi:hypothetical protein